MPSSMTLVEELQGKAAESLELEQETLAFYATEVIASLMAQRKITRTELARRINRSKSYITQLLSGSRNMTFHTFAQLAFALEHRIRLVPVPLASEKNELSKANVLSIVEGFAKPIWQPGSKTQQSQFDGPEAAPSAWLIAQYSGQAGSGSLYSA